MSLYLVGYMGSGKSSVGKRLGNRLELEFVDMDTMIEDYAKASVQDIFSSSGEDTFRSLENHILTKTFESEAKVVATGGGAACHSGNMEKLIEHGFVVYLELSAGKLTKRIEQSQRKNPDKRPLVSGKKGDDLFQYIKEHLEERSVHYDKAHMTVDADRVNSATLDKIKSAYLDYIHSLK